MFQFPANPIVGQLFNPVAGITYRWNGVAWFLVNLGALSKAEADALYQPLSKPLLNVNPHFLMDQIWEGIVAPIPAVTRLADGWTANVSGGGTLSAQRITDPNDNGAKCLEVKVTVADAALAAADIYQMWTALEGYDAAVLRAGQASAKKITIQFALEAPAGVYTLVLANSAQDRHYLAPITVPDAAEHDYSVTVPMDTAGVWAKDNTIGMYIFFNLGAGSNYTDAAGVWAGGAGKYAVAGQTNFMATVGNTLRLKRFEVFQGDVAQPYTPANYQRELLKCQRYYWKTYSQGIRPGSVISNGVLGWGSAPAGGLAAISFFRFAVEMRTNPAMTGYSPLTGTAGKWMDAASTDQNVAFDQTGTAGARAVVSTGNLTFAQGHITADARQW